MANRDQVFNRDQVMEMVKNRKNKASMRMEKEVDKVYKTSTSKKEDRKEESKEESQSVFKKGGVKNYLKSC